jgi:hypothetical protein
MNNNDEWIWKMDWCRVRNMNPANEHAWELAERALKNFKEQKNENPL